MSAATAAARERPGEHGTPLHLADRHARRLRHRRRHHAGQRPLAELAADDPDEQPLLRFGRVAQEIVQDVATARL
ncbi:MAG: hypothetical protein R2697_06000 [Ilumatobacteraceae bacterium]